MTLIDALPKRDGMIVLPVGGEIDGKPVEGLVDPAWLARHFPNLASAPVPLSPAEYEALSSISHHWAESAAKWRADGLI